MSPREPTTDAQVLRDLRGKLDAEAKRRAASDEVFRLLVESVEDYAICMLDGSGRVATWNPGAERIYGYSTDEIVGIHCGVFYEEDAHCRADLETARTTGRLAIEGWRTRKDRSRFWANVVLTPVRGGDGELVGYAHVTRDLTERKAAEEAQRVLAERFRVFVDSVRDYAIFMLDPKGNVETWNAGAERIKGYRADQIIGRHFSVFYPPKDVAAGACDMKLATAVREGRIEDEGWRVRSDGSRFWANVVITALHDSSGRLTGFGKVTRDLTERRNAELSRLATEERFHQLIDSVKDYAIFMLDPTGHVVTWNEGAQRIKGYRATEIIGSHFSRFYPEEDVRSGKCEMELEVAAREGRFEDEDWRVRKDGSLFWANVIIGAIRDGAGTLIGFSKVTRDLTERKRGEQERAARLAAEEANRTKDDFLAMLGHELRNPLAPIVTALQLIRLRGDADKTAREHEIIERQVARLTRLVDDLLDVSRIARGKLELTREPVDVRDAVVKAAEIARSTFEKKAQHFELKSPTHPLVVHGDASRLVQVFANLLSNAAKHTKRGGHIVVLTQQLENDIVVEVRDDGSGMDAALLPKIFDLFVQGVQDIDRAEGGLGLGLTLVKQIVDLHGGDVKAHSRGSGLGSTFVVSLPAVSGSAAPSIDEVPKTKAPHPDARRILIVDDNHDARLLLAEMLETLGYAVHTAADGVEALALLADHRPEVAILDIGLPGMDGYELASRIRETFDGGIQLIALTGYGQPNDVSRSQQAGFDAHLVKPVTIKRLIELIRPRE